MSRLIDGDALKLSMLLIAPGETKKYCYPCREILKTIDDAPTIEERKTGKWLPDKHDMAGYGYFDCSECGANFYDVYDFCPNCGADMREQP